MLAVGGMAVAWMAVPIVDLSIRGTADQRTVAALRSVDRRVAAPVLTIPAPRLGETAQRVPAA